jgi:hypothetical protein
MGPPALFTAFRKETKGAFLQFLFHKAQYKTRTPGRAAISYSVEVSVTTAYFVWQCLYFKLKMELTIEVFFELRISLLKDL